MKEWRPGPFVFAAAFVAPNGIGTVGDRRRDCAAPRALCDDVK